VSLKASAWLVSWSKTVMSLKGVSRNDLHSCRGTAKIENQKLSLNLTYTREKRRGKLTASMTTVDIPTAAMKTTWLWGQHPAAPS
jgi:hypothetical protein